jgi:hypothetical protein
MSSILRFPAQIPVRSKFFIGISTNNAGGGPLGRDAFTVKPGNSVQDVMTTTEVDANCLGTGVIVGGVYRDLGRQVTMVDASNRRVAVWRCVQRQDDIATEGAYLSTGSQSTADLYVRVWDAVDSTLVGVARLG